MYGFDPPLRTHLLEFRFVTVLLVLVFVEILQYESFEMPSESRRFEAEQLLHHLHSREQGTHWVENESCERESSEASEEVVGKTEPSKFEVREESTRCKSGKEVIGEIEEVERGEVRASEAKAKR